MHTVKIAMHSAEDCCTATSIAFTSIKQMLSVRPLTVCCALSIETVQSWSVGLDTTSATSRSPHYISIGLKYENLFLTSFITPYKKVEAVQCVDCRSIQLTCYIEGH